MALPLLMWPGTTDYNYAKSIASLVLISLRLLLWGLTAWRRLAWTMRAPWLLVPLFGFFLARVLSSTQATNSRVVAQSLILLAVFLVLFWMIVNVTRAPRDVRWILTALLASRSLAQCTECFNTWASSPATPARPA